MHPHLNHALASDRIRELTAHAARARLAGRHRRARRALLADRAAAGEINSLNVRAEGAAVEIARNGKAVSARLALHFNRSLAGRRLRVEVEAVDVRGARQLKSNAGSIRITN